MGSAYIPDGKSCATCLCLLVCFTCHGLLSAREVGGERGILLACAGMRDVSQRESESRTNGMARKLIDSFCEGEIASGRI